MSDSRVPLRLLALDQPRALGSAHEFGHGALRELHPLRQLGHGGLLGPARRPLDHHQQRVALGRESRLAGDLLAAPQEVPQG